MLIFITREIFLVDKFISILEVYVRVI